MVVRDSAAWHDRCARSSSPGKALRFCDVELDDGQVDKRATASLEEFLVRRQDVVHAFQVLRESIPSGEYARFCGCFGKAT